MSHNFSKKMRLMISIFGEDMKYLGDEKQVLPKLPELSQKH